MKLFILFSFFLAACSTTPSRHAHADQGDPAAAAKDMAKDATSDESGDPESHRQTVVRHADEFTRCYQPALRRNPKLQGGITLTWDIDSSGNVIKENIVAANTTIHDKQMQECMLDRLHMWKFDTGPKDTISTVTYPFYFKPGLSD